MALLDKITHTSDQYTRRLLVNTIEPGQDKPISTESSTKRNSESIQTMIKILVNNISHTSNKPNDRASWFTYQVESKTARLNTVSDWLDTQTLLTPEKQDIVLALIRDICASKRNALGLFQPHSLIEFHEYTKANNFVVPENISFSSKELNSLVSKEKAPTYISNLKAIDDLIESRTPTPQSSDSP